MADEKCIVGTCHRMCSEKEIKFRERNSLLHYLEIDHKTEGEVKADAGKVIKIFSRSAAGKAQLSPKDLRPSGILLKTVNYLVNEIIPSTELPWVSIYDFVNDRIQAVRQDMTIQMIEDHNAVEIFEKCVRFYIAASYILCEEPQAKFDQYLNTKQLTICLEKLFVLYEKFKSVHSHEFIAIHYTQNIIHSEMFYRSVSAFPGYISNNIVKLSMMACFAYTNKNIIQFFKLVKKLPLILLLCFFQHFPQIRNHALETFNVAFSSNPCKFPVDVLCSWFCVKEKTDILTLCQNCCIKTCDNDVCFSKKTFNKISNLSLKKEEFIDSKLRNVSLSKLINGFS